MPTVRAARLHRHGEPLQVEEVELPEPGPGEARVEIRFSGVNPIDRYVAEGQAAPDGPLPRTLGAEGAGESGGKRVLVAGGGLGAGRDGLWAEAAVVPRASLIELPDGVELEAAAAMGIAGLTALKCVEDLARVSGEDRVVALGASGGVGSMIVNLSRAAGAQVWGQTGSEAKRSFVEAQGAERVLVGDARGIAGEMAELQPTVVFDPLGADFVQVSLEALAPRGRLVSYGTSAGPEVQINMQNLYRKMISVLGYGGMLLDVEERRDGLRRALQSLRAGSLRVHVDAVLPLEQAGEAFRRLTERQVQGKLLLRP